MGSKMLTQLHVFSAIDHIVNIEGLRIDQREDIDLLEVYLANY